MPARPAMRLGEAPRQVSTLEEGRPPTKKGAMRAALCAVEIQYPEEIRVSPLHPTPPGTSTMSTKTTTRIDGNFTSGDGSIQNVGATLSNVTQTVSQVTQGSPDDRAELERLLAELQAALAAVPPEHADDAETVADCAKRSVEQIQRERPNNTLLQSALDGLQTAAKALFDHAPKILDIVGKLVPLITKLAGR